MNDLKRSKKKAYNKQIPAMNNTCEPETTVEIDELDRSCKCNNSNTSCNAMTNQSKHCNHKHETLECICECKKPVKPDCEPCQSVDDTCVENPCADNQCCNGISPTYSTRNVCPVAIEVKRIYDAAQFQIFTDATGPNGETLYFDYDVVEVRGRVPLNGLANVIIDEVCMNYSSLEVNPGVPTVEDFEVVEVEDSAPCDTSFEYAVCPERNATCCAQNQGQSVSYKERGLNVVVNDLVLELKGHCGCTNIVVFAYPAVQQMGGQLCRVNSVLFSYNTLACRLCIPSSGRSFTLRQDYRTSLTVDCISKANISLQDCCGCDCDDCFDFNIPSGIDLICCLEETVSVLVNDQVVVLATSEGITPRVVDTFSNVCNFTSCGSN